MVFNLTLNRFYGIAAKNLEFSGLFNFMKIEEKPRTRLQRFKEGFSYLENHRFSSSFNFIEIEDVRRFL
jgi:hypothetical protein